MSLYVLCFLILHYIHYLHDIAYKPFCFLFFFFTAGAYVSRKISAFFSRSRPAIETGVEESSACPFRTAPPQHEKFENESDKTNHHTTSQIESFDEIPQHIDNSPAKIK